MASHTLSSSQARMDLIISCVTPAVVPRKGSTHCASSTVTSKRCASTNRSRTLVSTCQRNVELRSENRDPFLVARHLPLINSFSLPSMPGKIAMADQPQDYQSSH